MRKLQKRRFADKLLGGSINFTHDDCLFDFSIIIRPAAKKVNRLNGNDLLIFNVFLSRPWRATARHGRVEESHQNDRNGVSLAPSKLGMTANRNCYYIIF